MTDPRLVQEMQVYTLLSFLNIFAIGTVLISRAKPRQRR